MSGFIRNITPESKGWEAELWFALRGAGGNNFGVVTRLTFAMEDAPSKTVYYELFYGTPDKCAQALLTWQQLGSLPSTDLDSLSSLLSGELDLLGKPGGFCRLQGIYMGSLNDFNKSLSVYTSTLADNGVYHDTSISTINAHNNYIDSIADAMSDFGGLDTTEFRLLGYGRGLADDGVYNLTLDSTKAVMYTFSALQSSSYPIMPQFDLSGPASATSRPPAYGDMAFSHTNNIFVSQMLVPHVPDHSTPEYWDIVARTTYILDAMKAAAGQGTKEWYSYQNYMVSQRPKKALMT